MVIVFANGPGDRDSIPGWVMPKTQKVVLDASLINTQHYKVQIKSKWSYTGKGERLLQYLGVLAIEKGAFGLPLTMVGQLIYIYIYIYIYIIKIYS